MRIKKWNGPFQLHIRRGVWKSLRACMLREVKRIGKDTASSQWKYFKVTASLCPGLIAALIIVSCLCIWMLIRPAKSLNFSLSMRKYRAKAGASSTANSLIPSFLSPSNPAPRPNNSLATSQNSLLQNYPSKEESIGILLSSADMTRRPPYCWRKCCRCYWARAHCCVKNRPV